MKWDVFISHASEDKEVFVKPLANLLTQFGVDVWYDEFTLKVGDSLSGSIDKGLVNSKYGIVVISKDFMKKNWPDYELRGLVSKEISGKKVILPIWHNIIREDILGYSPTLTDKIALSTNIDNIDDIAMKILEVIRPDIYNNMLRRNTYELQKELSTTVATSIKNVNIEKNRKIKHENLSKELLNRIMIINRALLEVFPITLEETIYNFKCEPEPKREVLIWEVILSSYLDFVYNKELSNKEKKEVFLILLSLSMGTDEEEILSNLVYYSSKEFENITSKYKQNAHEFCTHISGEINNDDSDE